MIGLDVSVVIIKVILEELLIEEVNNLSNQDHIDSMETVEFILAEILRENVLELSLKKGDVWPGSEKEQVEWVHKESGSKQKNKPVEMAESADVLWVQRMMNITECNHHNVKKLTRLVEKNKTSKSYIKDSNTAENTANNEQINQPVTEKFMNNDNYSSFKLEIDSEVMRNIFKKKLNDLGHLGDVLGPSSLFVVGVTKIFLMDIEKEIFQEANLWRNVSFGIE